MQERQTEKTGATAPTSTRSLAKKWWYRSGKKGALSPPSGSEPPQTFCLRKEAGHKVDRS